MRKTAILILLLAGFAILAAGLCPAEEEKTSPNLQAIEFITGFSKGDLGRQKDYNLIPLSVSFDFNLKNFTKRFNFNPRSLFQFQIEPFLGFISSPRSNFEGGTIFWFKIGLLPETSKFQPYFKLGAGFDYMTLHTREQSTQFNFTEQAGAGFHYYLTKRTSLIIEGRWRHLSNAAIKEPNHGINSYSTLAGISYLF